MRLISYVVENMLTGLNRDQVRDDPTQLNMGVDGSNPTLEQSNTSRTGIIKQETGGLNVPMIHIPYTASTPSAVVRGLWQDFGS